MVVYTGVAMSAGFDDPEQHPTLINKHKHTFRSASAHFHATNCPWKDWTGYAPSRWVTLRGVGDSVHSPPHYALLLCANSHCDAYICLLAKKTGEQ